MERMRSPTSLQTGHSLVTPAELPFLLPSPREKIKIASILLTILEQSMAACENLRSQVDFVLVPSLDRLEILHSLYLTDFNC